MLLYTYRVDYYASVKKKELLPFVTARMNLETLMLGEISLSVKDEYNDFTYMWNLINKLMSKTESEA